MKNIILARLNDFTKNEDGAVLPIAALLLPVLLGMVGLGVDASSWYLSQRNLQSAADAAALAAAWEATNGTGDYMEYAALKEAMNNGYDPDKNGRLDITLISDADGDRVRVEISQDLQVWFSSILLHDSVTSITSAEATVGITNDEFCVLSLDKASGGAVTTQGAVTIEAPNCGIAVNSDDPEALSVGGNSEINVGSAQIVGGYGITGGSAQFHADRLRTGTQETEDPYADLEIPAHEPCAASDKSRGTSISSSGTVYPGVYCGGISITGNTDIEFAPGVYILDGGDFDVTGGGTLYGENVTFILTNSGPGGQYGVLDITGGREIFFSAPEEGEEMEGVVFFQDPNAPTNGPGNKLTGTSLIELQGVAYFPSQELDFGGNNDAAGGPQNPCSKLIARKVTFHGNPTLGNNCEGVGNRDLGRKLVQLVR